MCRTPARALPVTHGGGVGPVITTATSARRRYVYDPLSSPSRARPVLVSGWVLERPEANSPHLFTPPPQETGRGGGESLNSRSSLGNPKTHSPTQPVEEANGLRSREVQRRQRRFPNLVPTICGSSTKRTVVSRVIQRSARPPCNGRLRVTNEPYSYICGCDTLQVPYPSIVMSLILPRVASIRGYVGTHLVQSG